MVYAKPPFGGPEQVLDYLGRYTHRVAIANSRLVASPTKPSASFWKDYRHHDKRKVMTLDADEFIRRFLLHVLPDGFPSSRFPPHRTMPLRLLARLGPDQQGGAEPDDHPAALPCRHTLEPDICPCCGSLSLILSTLPRAPPHPALARQ